MLTAFKKQVDKSYCHGQAANNGVVDDPSVSRQMMCEKYAYGTKKYC